MNPFYKVKEEMRNQLNELIREGRADDTMVGRVETGKKIDELKAGIANIDNILKRMELPLEDPYAQHDFPEPRQESDVIHYCLGFAFRVLPQSRRENIYDWDMVLAFKHKGWQDGRLNGLGGIVDNDTETPAQAMAREFKEESGIETVAEDWTPIGSISTTYSEREPYFVHCFATFLHENVWYSKFWPEGAGEAQVIQQERQTVLTMGLPQALMDLRLLPNCSLMIMAAAHCLLNNQVNVDDQASKPQVHLVYANDFS